MWNKTSSKIVICFCLWFPVYFCEHIVKLCEGSKVSFHYYVGSMFSCSRWVLLTGISSALQRKHPWEESVGTDVWGRRYPLTSALSVCRAFAFPASSVHGLKISIHWNWTGSTPRAGTHTSLTAWAPHGRVMAGAGRDTGLHRRPASPSAITLCTPSLLVAGRWWLRWVWAEHCMSEDAWGHLN